MKEIRPITQLLHTNTFHALSRSQTQFLTASQGKDLDLCMFIYFSAGSLLWSCRVQHSQRKTRNFFDHKFKHPTAQFQGALYCFFSSKKVCILDLNFTSLLRAMCCSFLYILIYFYLLLRTAFLFLGVLKGYFC